MTMSRSPRPGGRGHSRLRRALLAGLVAAAAIAAAVQLVTGDLRTAGKRPSERSEGRPSVEPGTTPAPGAGTGAPGRGPAGPGTAGQGPGGGSRAPGAGQPLKPVLGGLVDRHHAPEQRFNGVVTGFVASVPWAALQRAAGAPLAVNNPIDEAITVARARGLKIKLRVTTGIDAPEWAKRLDGAPVQVSDFYGRKGTVGRFWSERFGQAYLRLQQLLAARYDEVPELVQTTITRCTTMFAEPFLRQGRTRGSVQSLLRAGYTAGADEVCHRQQVEAHQLWQRTRSGLSFNPYQRISANGDVSPDEEFTEEMMVYCQRMLASRCVMENHSIRTTGQSRWYNKMYEAMRALGGPISFQTAAPARIGSLMETLRWAIEQGASSVELPVSYTSDLSLAALDPIDQRLQDIAELVS